MIWINNKCYKVTNKVKAKKLYGKEKSVWFYNNKELTLVRNAGFMGSFDFDTRLLDYQLNNPQMKILVRCKNPVDK